MNIFNIYTTNVHWTLTVFWALGQYGEVKRKCLSPRRAYIPLRKKDNTQTNKSRYAIQQDKCRQGDGDCWKGHWLLYEGWSKKEGSLRWHLSRLLKKTNTNKKIQYYFSGFCVIVVPISHLMRLNNLPSHPGWWSLVHSNSFSELSLSAIHLLQTDTSFIFQHFPTSKNPVSACIQIRPSMFHKLVYFLIEFWNLD